MDKTPHSAFSRGRRTGLVLLCMTTLAACSSVVPPANLQSPNVGFSDLSIQDVGFNQVKFIVTVSAENPNEVDIPLTNMTFDLNLVGSINTTGKSVQQTVTLPRKQTTQVPVEFVVPTRDLIGAVRHLDLRDPSKIGYSLKGRAHWGNGPFTVPFEKKGDLGAFKRFGEIFTEPPKRSGT